MARRPGLDRHGPVFQAEHDEDAQAILVSPDAEFLDKVAASINKLLPTMDRAEIIEKSINGRGALILVRDMEQAIEVANRIAPEHLELSVADPQAWLPSIRHAGAIFMGRHTSEALGDYCAGPQPRVADLRHRALLLAAGGVRLPEAFVDHLLLATRCFRVGQDRLGTGPWRILERPRPERRIPHP